MALIDHIDPVNRDIYLSLATVGIDLNPIDIYKEMRSLRQADELLRPYDIFLEGAGNISKGNNKATERFTICKLGTRLIPFNTSHTLRVVGVIITDDGQEGPACFDRTPLSAGVVVDIEYVPPQVEVITVSTGSGLSAQEATMLKELWQRKALDPAVPLVITDNSISIGGVNISIVETGTETILTRNP